MARSPEQSDETEGAFDDGSSACSSQPRGHPGSGSQSGDEEDNPPFELPDWLKIGKGHSSSQARRASAEGVDCEKSGSGFSDVSKENAKSGNGFSDVSQDNAKSAGSG